MPCELVLEGKSGGGGLAEADAAVVRRDGDVHPDLKGVLGCTRLDLREQQFILKNTAGQGYQVDGVSFAELFSGLPESVRDS